MDRVVFGRPAADSVAEAAQRLGAKRDDLQRIATNCMLDDWTFSNPRPIQGAQEIVPILESVY